MTLPKGYYVYTHWHHDTGYPVCFYVGKGREDGDGSKRERRYAGRRYRSKFWKAVVAKHGFTPVVVRAGMTESEAFALEIHLISTIGRRDLGTGPLVNLTAGGDGSSGYRHRPESIAKLKQVSPERRALYSQRMKVNNPMWDPDTKRRVMENKPDQSGINNPFHGKTHSDETRAKMSGPRPHVICTGELGGFFGKKHTEEAKAKMREARLRRGLSR